MLGLGGLAGIGLGGLAGIGLGGCASAPIPAPPLVGEPRHRIWNPTATPRGTVLLAAGLGTDSRLWDLPGAGGLAPALARRGLRVVALDLPPGDLAECTAAVTRLAAALPGPRPLIGLGLDLGGTALLGADGLDGVIALGAPVASGGFSPATRFVLTAPGAPSWAELSRHTLGGVPLHRLLLSADLPAHVHRPLLRGALAPMPLALRADWYAPGAAQPIPVPLPVLETVRRPRPTLLVLAPADALAPPWQCDATAFGVRREGLARVHPTRANGFEREFNHLDLVLHPDAQRRVWPVIFEWIDQQIRPG